MEIRTNRNPEAGKIPLFSQTEQNLHPGRLRAHILQTPLHQSTLGYLTKQCSRSHQSPGGEWLNWLWLHITHKKASGCCCAPNRELRKQETNRTLGQKHSTRLKLIRSLSNCSRRGITATLACWFASKQVQHHVTSTAIGQKLSSHQTIAGLKQMLVCEKRDGRHRRAGNQKRWQSEETWGGCSWAAHISDAQWLCSARLALHQLPHGGVHARLHIPPSSHVLRLFLTPYHLCASVLHHHLCKQRCEAFILPNGVSKEFSPILL